MSFQFRKFKVYNDAQIWLKFIFTLTFKIRRAKYYELASQVERAAMSVIMNVAEGSDRGSNKDFNRFLDISLGSLNETVAGLDIALMIRLITDVEFNKTIDDSEILAKQLGGFKKYLKNNCKL